jgi:hypothetical protein
MKNALLIAVLVLANGVFSVKTFAAEQSLKIMTTQGYVEVLASAVESVDLQVRDIGQTLPFPNYGPCTISGSNAQTALAAILFDQPNNQGYPGGMFSGKITIHFSKASGLSVLDRVFSAQNNELLEDALFPTITYMAATRGNLNGVWYHSLGCN